jgi:homogentisate 1,2-dioxygenase
VTLAQHPFDAVGWDGYLYPFTFNAQDFEPITGTVHQPPPIHQTFEVRGMSSALSRHASSIPIRSGQDSVGP